MGNIYPRILDIGTANPPVKYEQAQIAELFDNIPEKIKGLFKNSHIKHRHLYLPPPGQNGKIPDENNSDLRKKHLRGVIELGPQAINDCLSQHNITVQDIDYLVCVSSTGFLCPSISAYIVKTMGFRDDVHRVDIVGMGCNAGINSLHCATTLVNSKPNSKALLVCIEICSAAYMNDGTIRTGIVNSLFGDGVAAVLITNEENYFKNMTPQVVGFESMTLTEEIDLMRFDLVDDRLSFFLAKETPYVIGLNIEKPVMALLDKFNLKKRDINHWVIHSGGKKVLDSIKYNLGISSYDIRHTTHILNEFGNLSSCSVFFSLQRLLKEGIVKENDLGVAIAMGPGAAIETSLLRW